MLVALTIISMGAIAVSAADVADVTVAAEESSEVAAAANTITI